MDILKMREQLRETLEDSRMSRSERDDLTDLLKNYGGNPGRLKQVRAAAYDVARNELANHTPEIVITWLEEVTRAIEAAHAEPIECRCLFSPRDPCMDEICALLQDAKVSADICVFTITDDRIVKEIEAAHRRGVRVRILTDDDKSMDRGSDIGRMARAGISVRKDRDPAHMHHKFAIIDDHFLLTGSYNWTRSAPRENAENMLIIDHEAACRQFAEDFDRLWQEGRR